MEMAGATWDGPLLSFVREPVAPSAFVSQLGDEEEEYCDSDDDGEKEHRDDDDGVEGRRPRETRSTEEQQHAPPRDGTDPMEVGAPRP